MDREKKKENMTEKRRRRMREGGSENLKVDKKVSVHDCHRKYEII